MERTETNDIITAVFNEKGRLLVARKDSYDATTKHVGRETATNIDGIYFTTNNDGLDKNITSYQDCLRSVARMASSGNVVEFRIGTLGADGEVVWDKEKSTKKELKELTARLEKSGQINLQEEIAAGNKNSALNEKQKNDIFDRIINKEMLPVRNALAREGAIMIDLGVRPNIANEYMNKAHPIREAELRGQAPSKKDQEQANKTMESVVLEFERLKSEGKLKIEKVKDEPYSSSNQEQSSPKSRIR